LTVAASAGRLSAERVPTLSGWLDRYLDEVAATTVRPSTLHRYRQEVRLYIGPSAIGRARLDAIKPPQIAAFYREQLERLSPGSVRRLHALMRRALTVAVRWQLIPWNPVAAVDPPSLAVEEVRPYSAAEAQAFLQRVAGERFEARWRLAVNLGVRQGEALGLAWRDVDLDQRVALIRQTLQYRPGERLQLMRPKTARSRRTIPLPESVVQSLKLRREQQEIDRQRSGGSWEEWGLVFTTAHGTPISPRNDYRDFRRLTSSAGLRRARLHDLRHTAASLMLAARVNPRVVMEILGHSQINITMNTYTHVSPATARDAVALVEDALRDSAANPDLRT
jgi:integrase